MQESGFDRSRRLVLTGGLLAAAALAASCQSVIPSLEGEAASLSAREHLETIRKSAGLAGLSPDAKLEKAALAQSGYMAAAGKMNHTALRGRDFESRMKAGDIPAPAAENLAHGRMEMAKVFQMWVDSPPHRRNMLDPRFTRFGLANVAADDGRRYWTLVLGV